MVLTSSTIHHRPGDKDDKIKKKQISFKNKTKRSIKLPETLHISLQLRQLEVNVLIVNQRHIKGVSLAAVLDRPLDDHVHRFDGCVEEEEKEEEEKFEFELAFIYKTEIPYLKQRHRGVHPETASSGT